MSMNTTLMQDDVLPTNDLEEKKLRDSGFRWGNKGTHTSRTIMLEELRLILDTCGHDACRKDYLVAILDNNCLGKRTTATRKLSSQRLSELYALDPEVPIFQVFRKCWYMDIRGQTVLGLLLALARDPLLRITIAPVLRLRPGEELVRDHLETALQRVIGNRLSSSTLNKVVRNTASSWTQSGHLVGRTRKYRKNVSPTPVATAYALLLGYLTGKRGISLFETVWAKVLDAPAGELLHLAIDARRQGYLDIRQSGGIIEVGFSKLLASE